jgi:Membrane bound beta barrel domain (DUF5777)
MKRILFLAILSLFSNFVNAQVDSTQLLMEQMLAEEQNNSKDFVRATFKNSRLINFPTCEVVGKRMLDFRIGHRFGELNSGAKNAFGLDGPAGIRLGLDYGVTDWLNVGIGRSSFEKLIDGAVKVRILRQTTDNKMPVSLVYQGTANYTDVEDPNRISTGIDKYSLASSRMSYVNTLTLSRKFSNNLSLQINTFHVHYNLVERVSDKNDMFAVGFSGRYKFTQRLAVTFEYARRVNKYTNDFDDFYDPISIGLDIETGGHVFQLHFTNAYGINEAQYIPYTRANPIKGAIRFGFNISRVFSVGKKEPGSTW